MTDDKKIGGRIRELRLKKGMTQKELAGDHITRNMLSLIENGSSCPSVGTLMTLAERLNVPVGYFFTTSPEEEKSYHKSAVIPAMKRAFSDGDYEKCTELCDALPIMYADDEIAMIAATANIKTAIRCAGRYELNRAAVHLMKAADYSNKSIYLERSFFRAVEYYTLLFKNLNSEETPALLADLAYASPLVPHDMILYFSLLRHTESMTSAAVPFLHGTVCEKHIEAILMMKEEKWARALKILKSLIQDEALPYFMRYRVLCDLENASNKMGDMRVAYVSARRKLELLKSTD
ncbi:MAG: helix-turn-helix transcriptional regulator [Ruminococcaceae bacterium]|nr:helix-turn-helix transcriptional regulator [Oscillospiraceae bacterium]